MCTCSNKNMQAMRRWGAVAPAASVLRTMARPSATGAVSPFAAAVNACFNVENAMGLLSVRCDRVRDTATMPVPSVFSEAPVHACCLFVSKPRSKPLSRVWRGPRREVFCWSPPALPLHCRSFALRIAQKPPWADCFAAGKRRHEQNTPGCVVPCDSDSQVFFCRPPSQMGNEEGRWLI